MSKPIYKEIIVNFDVLDANKTLSNPQICVCLFMKTLFFPSFHEVPHLRKPERYFC